jgi:alkanesulfonate monooxygenase SsuD/methylene tetrahydromethanopterin reductase-like flavin-dependent oxidoreductase (luciferase family)
MKFAMFQTPFMRPSRSPREVFDWAVEEATVCDQAGLSEYWIGEHATMTYESIPSPELIIAAAARNTDSIKLCPGAHLLPYHHPGTLAIQVSWMTHVTQGRYILGIGSGAYPTDAAVRGIVDMSENHKMTIEALGIMQRIWSGEAFQFQGQYWRAGFPENDPGHPVRDPRPWDGKVDIALAGISRNSASMRLAGSRGYIPLSVYAGESVVSNHWETYAGAAHEAGLPAPQREVFRVVLDVLVADTDAEARKLALEGGMGETWTYLLPIYKHLGLIKSMLPDMDPDDVTMDHVAEKVWLVGSPETVAEKLAAMQEATGGWGTTLVYGHDYSDDPAPWNHSLNLLTTEVVPRLERQVSDAGLAQTHDLTESVPNAARP